MVITDKYRVLKISDSGNRQGAEILNRRTRKTTTLKDSAAVELFADLDVIPARVSHDSDLSAAYDTYLDAYLDGRA